MTNVVISFHQKILFFTLHHYSLLFWHSPLFRQFFRPLGSHSDVCLHLKILRSGSNAIMEGMSKGLPGLIECLTNQAELTNLP